ncbi:MAG: hypothetical protein IV108_06455 [Burkholderiales bacterium]|nr:hypothetical protein [Burkholderiales bacterium]
MNSTLEKIFVISIGVIIVLFLLLDGGAMTEATISGGMMANTANMGHSWIWIIPTLLIFGLGFLLAWIVLGKDDVSQTERHSMSDQIIEMSGHGNLRANGKD